MEYDTYEDDGTGQRIYRNHAKHLEQRKSDKNFWAPGCQACTMHREANEKSKRKLDELQTKMRIDKAWENFEQK